MSLEVILKKRINRSGQRLTDCSLVTIPEGFIMLERVLGSSRSHQAPALLKEVLPPSTLPVAVSY